jgi:hypothetical protein
MLIDRAKTDARVDKKYVFAFEGKALGIGSGETFHSVSKCMIHAVMEGFPGVRCATTDSSLDAAKCTR